MRNGYIMWFVMGLACVILDFIKNTWYGDDSLKWLILGCMLFCIGLVERNYQVLKYG